MMDMMIERLAGLFAERTDTRREWQLMMAADVLRAMRDPTPGMVEAMADYWRKRLPLEPKDRTNSKAWAKVWRGAWQAGIDEVLGEKGDG